MNRFHLIALLTGLLSTAAQAEIYKSVNPDGSISYSDKPIAGGKAIIPPEITPAPAILIPRKLKPEDQDKDKPLPYKVFKLVSPTNNTTIRNNIGDVAVSLKIKPELQTKHKHTISIYLDNKEIVNNLSSSSYTVKNIDRGSHTISATLHDKTGKALKKSQSITLHLHRFSTLHNKAR